MIPKCRSMPELRSLHNSTPSSSLSPGASTLRSKMKGQGQGHERIASSPSLSFSEEDRIDRTHANADEEDDGDDQRKKRKMILSRIEHISALLALCTHVESMASPCSLSLYVSMSRSIECSTSLPSTTNEKTTLENFVAEQVALCMAAPPDVHETTTERIDASSPKEKNRVYPAVGQRRCSPFSPFSPFSSPHGHVMQYFRCRYNKNKNKNKNKKGDAEDPCEPSYNK